MKTNEAYIDCVINLVDDDITILDSLSALITSFSLTVKCFESAKAFLDAYTPSFSGCLILDVRMPKMNGLELQEQMSQRNIQLPIIFISGNAEIADSAKAFRAGALDFLEKPFEPHLIMERIYEALDKDMEDRVKLLEKNKTLTCFEALTPREKEVLQLIVSNYSNKEIAKILGVSYRTIESHRAHLMEKMQAAGTNELIAKTVGHALFQKTVY